MDILITCNVEFLMEIENGFEDCVLYVWERYNGYEGVYLDGSDITIEDLLQEVFLEMNVDNANEEFVNWTEWVEGVLLETDVELDVNGCGDINWTEWTETELTENDVELDVNGCETNNWIEWVETELMENSVELDVNGCETNNWIEWVESELMENDVELDENGGEDID